jgi:hypothetical protein
MNVEAEATRAARRTTTVDLPGYTPHDDGSSIFDGHNSSLPPAAMWPVGALKSSDSVMMSSNTNNYTDDDDDDDGKYNGEYEDHDGAYDEGSSLPPQQVVHDRASITSMNTVDFMMTLLSNDDDNVDEDEDAQWQRE